MFKRLLSNGDANRAFVILKNFLCFGMRGLVDFLVRRDKDIDYSNFESIFSSSKVLEMLARTLKKRHRDTEKRYRKLYSFKIYQLLNSVNPDLFFASMSNNLFLLVLSFTDAMEPIHVVKFLDELVALLMGWNKMFLLFPTIRRLPGGKFVS